MKTGRIVYVGSYSVTKLPGSDSPCVKTVFPLPNGNAIVVLRPYAQPDGSSMESGDSRPTSSSVMKARKQP